MHFLMMLALLFHGLLVQLCAFLGSPSAAAFI